MDERTRQLIDTAAAEVERQTETLSRQPRFARETGGGFGSVLRWLKLAELEVPEYGVYSPRRDAVLRTIWQLEPHLAGVLNAVVLIDSNRGWTLTGGRNQVLRYQDILHQADGGAGWRTWARKTALSYWATDMGAVTEIGREGRGGPLRAIYHVDSARCFLTGKPETPLQYIPVNGAAQMWEPDDYFRTASMPSDDEALRGLGYCAVSRCLDVLRVLYAVMQHDLEQLGARAPRGLLLLQGISEEQWDQSLQAREEKLDSLDRRYYAGVQVLANSGLGEPMDAKVVALSQLPAQFDAKVFMDLSMYAYALVFGYDPSEFWPVQFGSLGRGTEAQDQARKASGKGGLEFALGVQEHLQRELPETLEFAFEQRDEAGELTQTQVKAAKLAVVTAAYEAGIQQGVPLVTWEEARQLLAEEQIIPEEWTEADEDIEVADTDDERSARDRSLERHLDSPAVRRAMERWPGEEIVCYQWPRNRLRTLWKPRLQPRYHRSVKRQEEDGEPLYSDEAVTITAADVDRAIAEARKRDPELGELLTAPAWTGEAAE